MTFVSLILAGGKSSRMGQSKSDLSFLGISLLQRQFNLLSTLSGDRVLVSGDHPAFPCVLDQCHEQGPLEGLRSATEYIIQHYGATLLLVVPVDMPRLDADVLLQLSDNLEMYDGVCYENFHLPCFLCCDKGLLQKIHRLKESDQKYSFASLFSMLKMKELKVLKPLAFVNLNTQKDWEEFCRYEYSIS